jgi:hypothetical protein
LDALWETASTIAGDSYPINPAEAYVFGAAILLHDAGMALASYPDGISEIYETTEWKDSVMEHLPKAEGNQPDDYDASDPPEQLRKAILAQVLRSLHAQRAEMLPFVSWRRAGGVAEYLIDDGDLREFYGSIIGQIAASHHASVTRLPAILQHSIGAIPKIPSTWTIDSLKLACLLRAADAAHIDERRAPRFLALLLRPEGISGQHWNFQSKLAKPRLDADVLVFTSGPEFGLADADAWWLCFDTICMIDKELRECDVLLNEFRLPRFAAKRVRAAESPKALSGFIKTKEWEPVDTAIRVADVPRVVRMLGGSHLYGQNSVIPIRELIQNGTDAIEARRLLENRQAEYGCVRIWLKQDAGAWWLNIEDDGVGMSERTLSGALLDFGKSFWLSEEVKREFPGLLARGMKSIGRFGIGFFSVFMLGDIVKVTSQRHDAAKEATSTLEFRSGLELRPILRRATSVEYLRNGGTRVSVKLKLSPYEEGGLLAAQKEVNSEDALRAILPSLCPSVEVNVMVGQDEVLSPYFSANDWTRITGDELLRRVGHRTNVTVFDKEGGWKDPKLRAAYGELVQPLLAPNGAVHGRACIRGTGGREWNHVGVVTVGGFSAKTIPGIGGILVGTPLTAARDSALPTVSAEILATWASQQAVLIYGSKMDGKAKLQAAGTVMQCGGDPGGLPIIKYDGEFPDLEELREILTKLDSVKVFEGTEIEYDEYKDKCHPREFENDFKPDPSVAFLARMPGAIIDAQGKKWPDCIVDRSASKSYETQLRSLLGEVWGEFEEDFCDNFKVGTANGWDIERTVLVFTRTDVELDF